MTRAQHDLRSAALDAYLADREADGYQVETRTTVQAVIVHRGRWASVRRLTHTGGAEHRLVVSVDEHGVVSSIVAEPVRW